MTEAVDQTGDAAVAEHHDAPREKIAETTIAWLTALPETVRPRMLPLRFPHMANALARKWTDPALVRSYLDSVLIDLRGNRQGLPSDVAEELATVKDYFETVLHPVPQTVWDEVASRKRTA